MGSHLLSDCQNTEEGNASECLNRHIPCFCPLLQLHSVHLSECTHCIWYDLIPHNAWECGHLNGSKINSAVSKWQAFKVNRMVRKIGKFSKKIGTVCEQWNESNTRIKSKKILKYIWIDFVHISYAYKHMCLYVICCWLKPSWVYGGTNPCHTCFPSWGWKWYQKVCPQLVSGQWTPWWRKV